MKIWENPGRPPYCLTSNFFKMKKVFLAVLALVFNMFLFSCEKDSITESETLFETQSTEGDDEDPKDPPTGNG